MTILIVTHNMEQAARVADFTGFMYLGELVEHGATSQIFQPPKTTSPRNTSPARSAS